MPHHHPPVPLVLVRFLLPDHPAREMEEDVLQARFSQVHAIDREAVLLGHRDELGDPPLSFFHRQVQNIFMPAEFFDPVQRFDLGHQGLRVPLDLEADDVAAEDILELMRRVEGHEFPVVHDGDSVAEIIGLFHVMRRQDDRDPIFFVQLFNIIPDVPARLGVQAEGRLVEKKDFRVLDQPARDLEAALHAARIFLNQDRSLIGQIDEVEDGLDPPLPFVFFYTIHHGVELEVFATRQFAVQGLFLEDHADAFADVVAAFGHIVPGDFSTPRRWFEKRREHVDRRRLSGAVGAEKPE